MPYMQMCCPPLCIGEPCAGEHVHRGARAQGSTCIGEPWLMPHDGAVHACTQTSLLKIKIKNKKNPDITRPRRASATTNYPCDVNT